MDLFGVFLGSKLRVSPRQQQPKYPKCQQDSTVESCGHPWRGFWSLVANLAKVGARSDWKVQVVVFTGGTPGSVEIERFENNLKLLTSKRKNGPISESYMPEHFWRPTTQFCEHTMKRYTQVMPRKCIIDTMSHRMSMCRRNSRNAQDMTIRETIGNRQKAIRMRVDG